MKKRSFSDMECSVAQTLELVGDRWTFLILRDSFLGIRRFDDFVDRLGISRNVLTDRLATLVDGGVLERRTYDEGRGRFDYVLTDKGRDLWPVITTLREWGDKWVYGEGNEPVRVEHKACGHVTTTRLVCDHCDGDLDARAVRRV